MADIELAITPGGRVGDASPLGKSGKRRLDDYVREVAHALMRKGYPKSHAIAVAKNSLKRWARGGGHVRPQVRAGAAAHLAVQKGLDVSSRGRHLAEPVLTPLDLATPSSSAQDGPRATVPTMAGAKKKKIRPGSIPSGKGRGKFPITDQKSVRSAAGLLHKAKGVSRATIIAHVKREAKRRGLKLTPAFQGSTPPPPDPRALVDLVTR
jgi:hypothetical protein